MTNEAFAQLHDRVNLQQTQTFEAYQLCNMEEYFDLRFSMQSLEIPVIIDERRSVSVSYISRELFTEASEKEIQIHREPSYATSEDLTFVEVTIIECNFVTTDVRFEFTSTSVSHAVAEAVVLTLIAQQSVQIHLSSQRIELRTSFLKQSNAQQLTIVISVPQKIVEKLKIKLGDRWVKLDVVLLSPMQNMAADVTNRMPRIIARKMDVFALIFEKCDEVITFDRVSEREYRDAVVLTKSVTYPKKIRRQFTVDAVWLEYIAVYKVPQVFDTAIIIDVIQKEMLHLKCKASEANTIDEVFTVWGPCQREDATVTFLQTLSAATSGNYIDSISSLEIILRSCMDQNLLISKEVSLVRMEMISMQLTASVFVVIPVAYSFSKPAQTESLEMKILVKPLTYYETSQRNFVDSVVKVELELWSQTERNLFAIADFRAVKMDIITARFFSSTSEYFDVSTAFIIQPKMDTVIATLPTKTPEIISKTSRLFSDTVADVTAEYCSQVPREFFADTIFLIPRIDVCIADFRASTFENPHVIASFEIQSQENSVTVILLMQAPKIVERSSFMFSDDLIQETAEIRSRIKHNLAIETKIFTARKYNLIENIKSSGFEEKNVVAIIEVRPEKEGSEFTLLTPIPTLIQEISRSFSDTVVNLITELHVQSDFQTENDIIIVRACSLQMYLKASKEENITVLARFCVQDEIENILAILLTRAPTITARNVRKFSDSLVKFVTELSLQVCREAFADIDIYIARNDKMQTQLKASTAEYTHAPITLEGYSEAEELEVTLSELIRADTYKLNRSFSYKTVDLIATLWFQIESNFHIDVIIPIKRKDSSEIYLKVSIEECTNILTGFEMLPQVENIATVLLTRAPTIVERTNRAFSSNLTQRISEIFSTMNRDLHTYIAVMTAMHETAEGWKKAANEENSYIKTCIGVESVAYYTDAIISIIQEERQLASVRAPSFENVEICTSFEFCSEEKLSIIVTSRIIATSKQIIEVTEKRYIDEQTKMDVEIYHRALNEEVVEADLMESEPPVWMSFNYEVFDERLLYIFASQFVEDIINTAYKYVIQESEENINIMVELNHNPAIQSSHIDLRNIYHQRRIIKEKEVIFRSEKTFQYLNTVIRFPCKLHLTTFFEMETSWNLTQLNIEFYQHLDLAWSAQTSEPTFILRENICEEGLLFMSHTDFRFHFGFASLCIKFTK